jgi:lipopolysaccharide transport system ATP-binding protein
MTVAIELLGVSKQYLRGVHHTHTRLLSGVISQWGRRLLGRARDDAYSTVDLEPFWALKDINLTIEQGEVIGIVGRNGSGKSTLLKIIAQITAPTAGEIRVKGRTGTLLEVGTGFHPELTGRENVYLNGAILGMRRAEIDRKFDAIVNFSGVEAFIDTPVKRYSSGMHTRLAFSIASHLEPEILIVDEVLAVGDADFQKRCLARMKDVTKEGRTVLFVSHSMSAVKQMCQKAIYLEKGRVLAFKTVDEATDEYQRDIIDMMGEGGWHIPEFDASKSKVEIFCERKNEVVCIGGSVETEDGICAAYLPIERPIHIKLNYRVLKDLPFALVPNFHVYDDNGGRVFISMPESLPSSKAGDYCVTCIIPPFQLNNGRYFVNPSISSFTQHPPVHFSVVEGLRFEVVEAPAVDERRHGWELALPGTSRPRLDWSCRRLEI